MSVYKLLAYKISESPEVIVGTDITQWNESDLNGNKPFIVHIVTSSPDVIPEGYSDISSFHNWHNFGHLTGADYKFVRDRCKEFVIDLDPASPQTESGGFDQLLFQDKIIAVTDKIGTHSQRVATVGPDNAILLGLQYHSVVSNLRQIRLGYAISEVLNRVGDAEIIVIEARNQILDYVFFGIEGTPSGDIEGILDYVWGLNSFSGGGLVNKNWNPEGLDNMTQLCERVERILVHGEYGPAFGQGT